MQPLWTQARKRCVWVAAGGVTLGVLQGLSLVNFAALVTSWLSTWLSFLVSLLLGGQPTSPGGTGLS